MKSVRVLVSIRRAACLVVPLLLVGAIASPASAKAPVGNPKNYYASVSPSSAAGGVATDFAFSIYNQNTLQGIGSADVTVPGPVTNVTGAPSGSAVDTSNPNLVHLRNLNISKCTITDSTGACTNPPQGNYTISATTPCTPATYPWGIQVKQANNFSGTGNDFGYNDPINHPLSTTIDSTSCKLAFVSTRQPASASLDETPSGKITSVPYNSAGASVQVEIEHADGSRDASSSAPITLGTAPQCTSSTSTSNCSLSPPVTVSNNQATASQGVATFSSIAITTKGEYRLKATSGTGSNTLAPAISDSFAIVKDSCTVPCTAQDSVAKKLTATLTANSGTGVLAISTGDQPNLPNCDDRNYSSQQPVWTHLPTTTTIDEYGLSSTSSGYKTLVLDIDKAARLADGPNNSPNNYQVCFSTTQESFTDRAGSDRLGQKVYPLDNTNGSTPQAGVLPDCNNTSDPTLVTNEPCVFGRGVQGADVILTVLLTAADRSHVT
jgi:hypothetical protein